MFFGGARSIILGRQEYFTNPTIYLIYNIYGLTLLTAHSYLSNHRYASAARAEQLAGHSEADDIVQWVLGLSVVFGAALFLYATGMSLGDLLSASRFAWFSSPNFSLLWLTVSSYFIALTAAFVYHFRASYGRHRMLAIAVFAAVILHGLATRDRKWLLFFASGWMGAQYELRGKTLSIPRRAIVALTVVFLVLVVSQFIRDVLFNYAIGIEVDILEEAARWRSFLIEYGDISYFYRASLEAIHQNLDNGVWIPFAMVRRLLFFFMPVRYSFGLKVEDISATFSDMVDGGDTVRRGNMPPGMFGLFVLSFGWIAAMAFIPLLSPLLAQLDRLFLRGAGALRQSLLSLFLFSVVMFFRGDDSSALYFVISTALVIFAANKLRLLFEDGILRRPPPPMQRN